jgi:hypothetical protein
MGRKDHSRETGEIRCGVDVEPADTSDRRVGALLLGGLKCAVSEDPDGNRPMPATKPQARSTEATPGMAAADRQETTTSFQNHGSDLDR